MNLQVTPNRNPAVALEEAQPLQGEGERSHIPALDGLRGVAILLVVASHAFPYQLSAFAGYRSILKNLLCSFGFGVQLFFVLSGFLITGILLDSKTSKNYFITFFARRVLRIFPLYYGVVCVIGILAVLHSFAGADLLLHRLPWLLTYSSNIRMTLGHEWYAFNFGPVSMGHFWSLAVEEQFYLIWPAIVFWSSAKTLKWLCLFAIPLGYGFRVLLLYGADNPAGAFVFTLCQVDALAIGALIAVLVREREETVARWGWPLAVIGGLGWLVACTDKNLLVTAGVTAFSLMSAGLLIISLFHASQLMFSNVALRALGKFSYAIYVFHVLLLPFVLPLRDPLGLVLFTAVFVALSFIAGWLSWHLYEKYFLRLKRYFPTKSALMWRPHLRTTSENHPQGRMLDARS